MGLIALIFTLYYDTDCQESGQYYATGLRPNIGSLEISTIYLGLTIHPNMLLVKHNFHQTLYLSHEVIDWCTQGYNQLLAPPEVKTLEEIRHIKYRND